MGVNQGTNFDKKSVLIAFPISDPQDVQSQGISWQTPNPDRVK